MRVFLIILAFSFITGCYPGTTCYCPAELVKCEYETNKEGKVLRNGFGHTFQKCKCLVEPICPKE